jgi:autotransporter translocation and assembly factor TamB
MNTKAKKYLRKSLKILLWTVGSIIGLFLLIVLLLQIPYFQNILKEEAVAYLEGKIGTEVQIGRIEIGLPKKVILEGVYFESQQGDTLLAGDKLAVDISLMKLLSNEVEINSIDLQGIVANVRRNKDSVFNFDYIIDAFASGKPKDTTSAPMKFSMDKINLDRIRITFNDEITKNNLSANIRHFNTRIKKFDLDKLEFEIPKVKLDGLKVRLKQGLVAELAKGTQKVAEEASKKPDLKLKLGEIDFTNIDVGYDNEGSHLDTGIRLNKLLVEVNTIDLKGQLIDLENIELNGLKGQLAFSKFEKQVQQALPEQTQAVAQAQWKIKLANADIKNVAFKFDDQNAAPVARGIDYKHLDITNFNLEAKDFSYAPNAISGDIRQLTLKDKSGLNIREFHTEMAYGPKGAELRNLYLKTPQTLLKDQIVVTYPSLESLNKNIGEMAVDANIDGSRVAFKDVLLFVPGLATTNPFKSNPNAVLEINSRVKGKVKDLRIANLEVSGIGSTTLAASGRIIGLPDAQNAYFDINVRDLRTTSKDIKQFVPAGTIPANIQLPANLSAKATFKGRLNNFNTNVNLASSFGNAKVKALFDQRRKGRERYDADVDIANFNVGRLISNDSIGRVTLRAKVKGTGLDPQTASARLKGRVIKAEYNSYTYRDLTMDGTINNGRFNVVADMDDPNIDFDLVADGGFRGKYPNGKIKLNVDIADLDKLNLHAGPLKLRGNVDADIADGNPDNLNGTVSLHHFMFANAEEQFALDSINIVAVSTPEKNSITLKSTIAKASVEGKYKLTELGDALSNTIAKYYNSNSSAPRKNTGPQQFDFSLYIDNDPVLFKLVPQITRLEPISITGRYNSVGDTIVVNGNIPRLVYGPYTISGGVLTINTQDDALNYSLTIDEVQSEQFLLPQTNITGVVRENLLSYRLQILDRKEEEQYLLAGELRAANGGTEISLDPENLKLNYESWNIAVDNVLRFGKGGIYADNFVLSNNGGSIALQSQSEAPNAPLDVELENFQIQTLTNMVQKDELKIGGTLNGTAQLRNLATNPVFVSDLDITNFTISNDTVGDIKLKVDNLTANTYTADVAITGNGNQVNLDGTYRADTQNFNLNLDINKLNMSSLQAFTFGEIKEGSGYLSGQFKITGTPADPNVNGNLKFNDVAFRVTQLNSYFKSINETVAINDRGITLANFMVQDEESNILNINGYVATTDFKDYGFNLTVDANNFRAVNSTAKDNDLYYGNLYIDAHLNVKGDMNSPVIDGNLKVNEDTKFTVVLPQQDPSIADREGIVEFIDQDNVEIQQRLKMEESLNTSKFKGMDVSVAIEIVKEAELNLIVDKGNGDFLQLQGEAQLQGGIDKSGKTTLTGRYEFTEGAYQMTFNFIKRKFDIQKGSYILWTGEPTDAMLNITAVYKTETAPIDLVEDQLGSMSQSQRNTFKQRIPFNTLLKINGELLKPELSFDIVLPEGNYGVSTEVLNTTRTKLEQIRQQPSELNKQVFAILLLNRFIGENPFASEAGGDNAESIARQSVSKILSQQLNNFAANLIQGVELNFDLESTEDYTTGEMANRTDLNVGVSKRLFDDRLKVTVGSSFGLEGPQQTNEETTNIAGDVSAEYQLTQDGRYAIRAYRKNDYQVALQGQVIETGVAFIITMDYNKFRELFHRTEEEKLMRQREKERKEREKREKEKKAEDAETNKVQDLPPNTEPNEKSKDE